MNWQTVKTCFTQCSKLLPVRLPEADNLEEDWELFWKFSSILCLWFEIQGRRTDNFFDWVLNTVLLHTNWLIWQHRTWPTLVQVMDSCLTAPSPYLKQCSLSLVASHYLSQCWPIAMSPYGVSRPQWVKQQLMPWGLLECNRSVSFCEHFDMMAPLTLTSKTLTVHKWHWQ